VIDLVLDANGQWSCREQPTQLAIEPAIVNLDFAVAGYRNSVPRHGQATFFSDDHLVRNRGNFRIDHGEPMPAPICVGHV
jgi:hypothetical protein